MLFHVTMIHSEDNCPAYHTQWMPEVLASMEKLKEKGKELSIKVHMPDKLTSPRGYNVP